MVLYYFMIRDTLLKPATNNTTLTRNSTDFSFASYRGDRPLLSDSESWGVTGKVVLSFMLINCMLAPGSLRIPASSLKSWYFYPDAPVTTSKYEQCKKCTWYTLKYKIVLSQAVVAHYPAIGK